jgi:1-acyl-sn-glycerol-3-phosphate acyltransferase
MFPAKIKKAVIIVAPHTSSWDFVIGLAYRSILGLQNAHFLGKQELFKPPFGFFFKWLGGTPVNRQSKENMVEQVAKKFEVKEEFLLALSPEGTRKKVDRLRTGFYYIALEAKVPIVLIGFDFKNKTIVLGPTIYPTTWEKDYFTIVNFFAPIEGRIKQNGLGHLI